MYCIFIYFYFYLYCIFILKCINGLIGLLICHWQNIEIEIFSLPLILFIMILLFLNLF